MTTTNLNLNTYNHNVNPDKSFEQYRLDLNGTTDSSMTLIDDWSGLFASSIISMVIATAASMVPVNALLSSISGSIISSRSASPAISGSFALLDSFSGSGQADFTSISSSYTNLLIIGRAMVQIGGPPVVVASIGIDFNGDSGSSNYLSFAFERSGSAGSSTESGASYYAGQILAGKALANDSGYIGAPFFILIPNYSSSGSSEIYKNAFGFSAGGMYETWPTTSGWMFGAIQGGTWISTSAINRIRMFGSFDTTTRYNFLNSEISLYGFV